jgi:Ca2+-binding RTX toxin-like protein
MLKKLLLATSLVLATLHAGSAAAFTEVDSPWEFLTPVEVIVGKVSGTNIILACYRNLDTGIYKFREVPADAMGRLRDNVQVNGATGADAMYVLSSSSSSCGFTMIPFDYNGHFLDLAGKASGDTLVSLGAGDTWLWGGIHNDYLLSGGPTSHVIGSDGNDILYNISTGSGNEMYGNEGNDCLFDSSSSTNVIDCGNGSDSTNYTTNATCESIVGSC